MGYTLPDQREIFSFSELSESFDVKRMSLGGPIFDLAKLKWLNGRYLREKLDKSEVLQRLMEWKANPEFLGQILPLALQRLETFSDFFPLAQFLLTEAPDYPIEALIGKMEAGEVAKFSKLLNGKWKNQRLESRFTFQAISKNCRC